MSTAGPADAEIRLSGSDTTFILDEAVEPQHTLKIAVFDEPSSRDFQFERTIGMLADAVAVLPQMQWRIRPVPFGLGRPVWITDAGFDVRNHVRHARLPEPGTKAQLCHLIGDVAGRPIPAGLPPWEVWFVEGYEGGKVVAVLKMNHALADGARFVELLEMLSRPAPGGPVDTPQIPHPPAQLSDAEALRGAGLELWNQLRREVPRRLRAMRRGRAKAAGGTPVPRSPSVLRDQPELPWSGPLTQGRSFSWATIPLDEVKQMAKAQAGTVNAVVFAVVAGAIREYLADHGKPFDRPVVANSAAKVSRDADTRLWGTTATNRTFTLPTDVGDPMERLREAIVQTKAVRASVDARPVQREEWFDLAPPAMLRPMLRFARLMGGHVHGAVIVSNVKGPQQKRYFGGMGVENFISCGHVKYVAGINVTVWSYNGMLNFAVFGCSRTLPDPDSFTCQISAAFDELRSATGMAAKPAGDGARAEASPTATRR